MFNETLSTKMWKRFVQEGVIDSSRINKRITESWIRCKNRYVDPYRGIGRDILTGEAFERQKHRHQELLDVTRPHVEKMSTFIEDTGMIAILIDPDGYVLSMKGKKPILQYAGDINFVEGVRWTEDEVGTNAIGTAIHAKEPILVTGTEHYSMASHKWSCSAAPIHDDEGRLAGILDISCPVEQSHPNMLAIVSSIAYTVEQEWNRRREQDELELIRCTWEIAETSQPVVFLNQKQQVIFANKTVRQKMSSWSGKCDYQNLLREYEYVERKRTPVYSRRHGRLLGYCVQLGDTAMNVRYSMSLPASFPNIRFQGETGTSKAFLRVLKQIERIAQSSMNVCVRGESGTGKELVARAIHENSPQRSGPFVAVNCGAIPKDLIESELFGYAEGAFTGSRRHGYKGKLQQAHGGTLFLDEIGEIPHQMQVALLRVLQERKVVPIGSTSEIPVHIRVIAATHRDIARLVQEGKFREDLYYRLHVFPLYVPPLRERKEDIPHLIRYYCRKNKLELPVISSVMPQLLEYDWPGNIRELFNMLDRLSVCEEEDIPHVLQELFHTGAKGKASPAAPVVTTTSDSKTNSSIQRTVRAGKMTYREEIEKQSIIQALQKTNGSASAAAGLLGIPRSTFYRKLQKYNL